MRSSGLRRTAGPGPDPSANPDGSVAPEAASGQLAPPPLPQDTGASQYTFLLDGTVEPAVLARAAAEAVRCGVAPHEVLLVSRALTPLAYASVLARTLGVPLADRDTIFGLEAGEGAAGSRPGLPAQIGGRPHWVLCAEDLAPDALREQVAALQARGLQVAVAPRFRIEEVLEEIWRADRLDRAVMDLARREPASSAKGGIWPWQWAAAALGIAAIVCGLALAPDATTAALMGLIALPFLCVTLLRVVALREALFASRDKMLQQATALPDHALPFYTVLVPLLRETGVVGGLVRSLGALDYPAVKLEILLVLEASDGDTQAALRAMQLPTNFRVVVVPDAAPLTKPKALNYALQFAHGEFIVVYDAEDRPEAGQLRAALAAFHRHPPDVGCLQARLNIYNPRASWFTRQFAIEYSALFDTILPALARLGLPVPLGGTSNHFRRETVVAAGGWDPFNVTEDADLGFRLARQGLRTAILASTTWEEAPATLGRWFRQRTRWLKGWMLTYAVHTRRPLRLQAELGLWGALGFHILMGGLILSALAHPWFYALLAYHAVSGQLFAPADTLAESLLWTVACVNLGAGYLTSILVGALSVWRRERPGLMLSALFMPLTWLLMSAAAYRALYQLVTNPYLWEKTEHGPLRRSRRSAASPQAPVKPSSSDRASRAARRRTG